jgi:hypothetical protein
MKLWVVVFLVAVSVIVLAATAPNISPLSKDEVIEGRTAQLDYARADGAFSAVCNDQCRQALALRQQALTRLQAWSDKVYADRKITAKDAVICDGPTPGIEECKEVKNGVMELVTKKEAKK